MADAVVPINVSLAVVLVVLMAAAALVTAAGGLGAARSPLLAAVRATVQLAAVSGVIVFLLNTGWWAAFVLLMLTAATLTSARRITGGFSPWTALPVLAGVLPVLGLVLGSQLVPLTGIAVIPIGGILIGSAMTATTLAGRRALDELHGRYGEYEAALALGLPARSAALEVARSPASEALIPALDQTRTVGLVTLPGAYVGVLLGGAGPWEAGAAQLLVLVGILAVQATAVLITIELVARGLIARAKPAP